jgi:diguanylate cyclase (GGDEF)-like protein/PAS domain S-box-containing protein
MRPKKKPDAKSKTTQIIPKAKVDGSKIRFPVGDISDSAGGLEALRESEERYRSLFDRMMDGVYRSTHAGKFVDVNPAMVKMFGYSSKEEMLEVNIKKELYFAPEERGSHILDTGREEMDVYRMRRKDGSEIWVEDHGYYIHDEQGRIIYHEGMLRDITERKQAEQMLGQNEERYRDIVENSQDLICTHDLQGKVLSLNLAAGKSLGYPLNEIIGRNIHDFLAPGREKAFAGYLQEIKEKGAASGLLQMVIRTGEKRIWEFNNNLRTKGVKEPIVRGMARDVTERFKAEKALRESESSLQGILRSTTDGILAVGTENQVLFANERFAEIWRIPQEVMASKEDAVLLQYILDQLSDPQGFLRKVQELYRSAEESFDTLDFKDGRVFERLSRPLMQGVELRGRVWSFRDITRRKQAEKLQDAVYRIAQATDRTDNLDSLFPSIHAIVQEVMTADNFYIALYDEKNDLLSFPYSVDEDDSPALPKKPGKGLTEYVLRTTKSVLCDEALYEELIQRGEIELVGAHSPIWLGVPLNIADKAIGVMVVQDYRNARAYSERERHILEFVSSQVAMTIHRKRAESNLRESEERFRTILDNIEDGYYEVDLKGSLTFANRAYVKLLGYTENELIGMDYHQYMSHETAKIVFQTFNRVYRLGIPEQAFGWEWICKDGMRRSVEISVTAIKSADGSVVGFRGIVRDITGRKQVEDALRQSEANQRMILDNVDEIVYWTEQVAPNSSEGVPRFVSNRAEKMFGYQPHEFLENPGLWFSLIHPDDIPAMGKQTAAIFAARQPGAREYRIRSKHAGEYRWMEDIVVPRLDTDGNVIGTFGVARDITERKRAEEELLRAKDSLETAHRELQQLLSREKVLARTDDLTGLCNRRQFFEFASREFHASVRHQRLLTILMFDADNFKQINDTLGHAVGDKMLALIAQAAAAQVRASDVVARYGGDEFIVLLPNSNAQQAFPIAERIRTGVAAIGLETSNAAPVITLSIGISEIRHKPADENVDRVIQRADEALYQAKQDGRNRIVIR